MEASFPYLDQVDDLMLMSIRPGWSFQTLNPEVYPRLEAARAEIDRAGVAVELEIDGGVKVENATRAVEAGATVLIAASGIFATAGSGAAQPAPWPRSREEPPRCRKRSSSSTTIRISRGSSRSTSARRGTT